MKKQTKKEQQEDLRNNLLSGNLAVLVFGLHLHIFKYMLYMPDSQPTITRIIATLTMAVVFLIDLVLVKFTLKYHEINEKRKNKKL